MQSVEKIEQEAEDMGQNLDCDDYCWCGNWYRRRGVKGCWSWCMEEHQLTEKDWWRRLMMINFSFVLVYSKFYYLGWDYLR